jgi:hypothetical protein
MSQKQLNPTAGGAPNSGATLTASEIAKAALTQSQANQAALDAAAKAREEELANKAEADRLAHNLKVQAKAREQVRLASRRCTCCC